MSHSLVLLRKEHTHEEKNPKKKKNHFTWFLECYPIFHPIFLSLFFILPIFTSNEHTLKLMIEHIVYVL